MLSGMRMSDFWGLVDGEFGPGPGRTLVRDHVLSALGHRTGEAALAGGVEPRAVWAAICDDLDVPPERRWGRDTGSAARGRRPRR